MKFENVETKDLKALSNLIDKLQETKYVDYLECATCYVFTEEEMNDELELYNDGRIEPYEDIEEMLNEWCSMYGLGYYWVKTEHNRYIYIASE